MYAASFMLSFLELPCMATDGLILAQTWLVETSSQNQLARWGAGQLPEHDGH